MNKSLLFLLALSYPSLCYGGISQSFDGPNQGSPFKLYKMGKGAAPGIKNNSLQLLSGEVNQISALTFQAVPGAYKSIKATFKMKLSKGADGFSLVFLSMKHHGQTGVPRFGVWEEPNIKGSFAIGFDIYSPSSKDRFRGPGNIYNRPQREISLHFDGGERENRLSPVEFRSPSAFVEVETLLQYVVGGSELTLKIGGKAVYDRFFLPGVLPYESRLLIGARTGGVTCSLALDDIQVKFKDKVKETETFTPKTVSPFQRFLVNKASRFYKKASLPKNAGDQYSRVVLRYGLHKPEGGWDPWDRSANVVVKGKDGTVFEIARIITPYQREWVWHLDVTDFLPLLTGEVEIGVHASTWTGGKKGFLVTCDFDYYKGPREWQPYKVERLWSGSPKYGDPKNPIDNFFKPKTLTIDPEARKTALRFVVTGHGMHPNTGNAAEFLNRRRWVEVGEGRFVNRLWRQDCYLNPCRPQGGTWKYDRAGWAPGADVRPWILDISKFVKAGEQATLKYTAEAYLNKHKQNNATHWVESHIVYYKKRGKVTKLSPKTSQKKSPEAPTPGKKRDF